MKNKLYKFVGLLVSCAVISACSTDFDDPVGGDVSSGSADFTKFVSIGDSLTAGYADGVLYLHGQENSYPAILAGQFAKAGGGSFTQPLMSDNLGGLLFGGAENDEFGNRLVLDAETETPVPIDGTPTTEVFNVLAGSFNNMGVPGAKSFHLTANGYGDSNGLLTSPATANPYFVRFATSATTSMLTDAETQEPTFFVLWIGNNDVLSFATSGGRGTDQTGNIDPNTYGEDDITDPNVFAGIYSDLVSTLTASANNPKGLLVNIPDVSTIPFFTTVPFNAIPMNQATAEATNQGFADYNAALDQFVAATAITQEEADRRKINFSAGQNAVVILDEDLTDLTGFDPGLVNMRQATADDLLVLTTRLKLGTLADQNDATSVWGVGVPLLDEDVLIPSEISAINTATTAYNATIKDIADADSDLLFFDVAALMEELDSSGVDYGTGFINADYATGSAFSLDGVHPTARGYAVIANRMIDVINQGLNANIPPVNPGDYTTIFVK